MGSNPFVDLTGRRFGKLIALSYQGQDKSKRRMWLCQCDCGKTRTVAYSFLNIGHTTSCGCRRGNTILQNGSGGGLNRKPKGEACFHNLFLRLQHSAKSRGHLFCLTEAEVRVLTQMDCYYCGQHPSQISQARGTNGIYLYNGIDRIDNNKDYTSENVRPCCKTCNFAKHALSEEAFFQWIDRLIVHNTKRIAQLTPG